MISPPGASRAQPTPAPPRIYRHAAHLLVGSSISVAGLYAPVSWMVWGLVGISAVAMVAEAVRAVVPPFNDALMRTIPLFKPAERSRVTGATFLILAAMMSFVWFDREVAVLGLLFIAVGDPAAAILGSRSKRGKLFGKSLVGTVAFAIAAGAAAALTALHPNVPLVWWVGVGVVVAALVELLPLPLDDNFTVPLAAGGVMAGLAIIIG
jgi:dolichol kinase